MVFQETSLVPSMTVAQNIYLGEEKFLNRLRGICIAAQQFLQPLNFTVDPTATVASLGAAKRQMVEFARAVADDGLAVVVISSYLPEIINLSGRMLVCRQGRVVEEVSPINATE